jgi:hypothetical protein
MLNEKTESLQLQNSSENLMKQEKTMDGKHQRTSEISTNENEGNKI